MAEVDGVLVTRVLAGDRSAFDALVERHIQRATALAHSVLGPDAAADDAVQNAFLKAYQQLGSLSEPESFPAWLLRIVRNEAITWQRRSRRLRAIDPAHLIIAQEAEDDQVDEAQRQRRAALRTALPRLRRSYREILALKYDADLSYGEIAESLGTSLANVEKRLYRARQALLKVLNG